MSRIKKVIEQIFSKETDTTARLKVIIAIGIAAMLLIALPDALGGCREKQIESADTQLEPMEYAALLEERLEKLISQVEGAGETRVMVTLQNGVEYIYASEDKTSINTSESLGNNGSQSSEAKENSENSYIIMKDDNGERALVRTELMPSVNGVVVVCEGADDPQVAERIKTVVTTALNISSKRVCITLLSTD